MSFQRVYFKPILNLFQCFSKLRYGIIYASDFIIKGVKYQMHGYFKHF
jgi:hypothetical protein